MGNDENASINSIPRIGIGPAHIIYDPRVYKAVKKEAKGHIINYAKKAMSNYNERKDNDFNARHPNTQGDIFDRFNNSITNGLYSLDNDFGTGLIGHCTATSGRIARDNYELHYQRSPFTDEFERSYHAFQNATDLGL